MGYSSLWGKHARLQEAKARVDVSGVRRGSGRGDMERMGEAVWDTRAEPFTVPSSLICPAIGMGEACGEVLQRG